MLLLVYQLILKPVWLKKLNDNRNSDSELNKKRLESLLKISQHQFEKVNDLLEFTLEEILSITESEFGYIYYYDESKKEFILNNWSKHVMPECKVANPQTRYSLDKTGIWGDVVRTKKVILDNDFKMPHPSKKGLPQGHVPIKKFLAVPIFNKENIVATVGVANRKFDYTDEDAEQIMLMMNSIWKIITAKQYQDELSEIKKENALGTVISGIAHEINNPLYYALEYADLINEEIQTPSPKLKEILGKHKQALAKIKNIITEMNHVISNENDNIANFDLEQCIQNTINLVSETYKNHNIEIIFKHNLIHKNLNANEKQVSQVILNILSNSKDAIIKKNVQGIIDIDLSEKNGVIKLIIKDNGIGLNQHEIHKVFDPFYTNKSPGSGTGLGLTVSKKIITKLNGTIKIESEEGESLTVIIEVPYFNSEIILDQKPSIESNKVLIIDDEEDGRFLTQRHFKKLNFEIDTVDSAIKAFELIKNNNYKFIVSDIKMPEMDGLAFVEFLLTQNFNTKEKIILFSGVDPHTYNKDKAIKILPHIRGFLQKPIDQDELKKILQLV